jgi:uncharacterized protein (TIRG00374 family)
VSVVRRARHGEHREPRSWRTTLLRVARPTIRLLIAAAVIEYILLPQIAGARKTAHLLADVEPWWAVLGVAMEAAALLAYVRFTQVTLHSEAVGFGRLLQIDMSTMAVSHVVPAGSAVGVGLGYRLLTRSGVSGSAAMAGKTVQTVGSAVILNLLLALSLVAALLLHGNNSLYAPIAGAGLLLLVGVGVATVLVTRGQERVSRILAAVLSRLPRVDPEGGRRLVASLASTVRMLASDRKFLRSTVVWATANWIFDAASLWCFVRAFGHTLGPVGLLVAHGLANVAAALPLTPGGLGVVEGVLVPTLVAFDTTRGVAILGVLGWRLVNFWLPIPIGFGCLARLTFLQGPEPIEQATESSAEDSERVASASGA